MERAGQLVFSKKQAMRFPAEGEVVDVVQGLASGLSLDEARERAAERVPEPIPFLAWLSRFLKRKQK